MWALRAVSTTEDTEEHGGEALTAECAESAERENRFWKGRKAAVSVDRISLSGRMKGGMIIRFAGGLF